MLKKFMAIAALCLAASGALAGPPADFIAYGADPTGATDSTAAIQSALDANAAVYCPSGTFKIVGTIYSRFQGQAILTAGDSCVFKNAQEHSEPWLSINHNNFTIYRHRVIGHGNGIGVGVLNRVSGTRILDPDCDSTATPGQLLNCWELFDADDTQIERPRMEAATYGVVQTANHAITGLRVMGMMASNIYADAIELNGAGSLATDVEIDVHCNGSHSYPSPAIEERCLGITSAQDVRATVWAAGIAGDSAIHLEDIGGREDIEAHLIDIQTGGGNPAWIYSIGNSKSANIRAWCTKTDGLPNASEQFCFGSGTGYYQNPITIQADCLGPSNKSFSCFDFSFHVGGFVKVRDSSGRNLTNFVKLLSSNNVDVQGSYVTASTNCIYDAAIASPSASGATDIEIKNNAFECSLRNIETGPNTSGTNAPYRWTVENNRFFTGYVFGNQMTDGYLCGNTFDGSMAYFTLAWAPHGPVIQTGCNLKRGVGAGP